MLFYVVVFLNRGSKREMIKKSSRDHEKTLQKINKYKKKNLEKLKPQKKVPFYEKKIVIVMFIAF